MLSITMDKDWIKANCIHICFHFYSICCIFCKFYQIVNLFVCKNISLNISKSYAHVCLNQFDVQELIFCAYRYRQCRCEICNITIKWLQSIDLIWALKIFGRYVCFCFASILAACRWFVFQTYNKERKQRIRQCMYIDTKFLIEMHRKFNFVC